MHRRRQRIASDVKRRSKRVRRNEDDEAQARTLGDFEMLNPIGEGTHGLVYKAKDKKSGEIVAVKTMKEKYDDVEARILSDLDHPSIVAVKHVIRDDDVASIVMEYVENDVGSLLETTEQGFGQSEVRRLMQQLLQGVRYLHANKVLHRDLKPSNLLLNSRGQLKICDFSLARRLDSGTDSIAHAETVVTLWYRAPELLLGATSYSTEIDMWSVGCIMAELLSRRPLFDGDTEADQLGKIFKILGTPDDGSWAGFSQLPGIGNHNQRRGRSNSKLRQRLELASSSARLDLLSRLLTYDPLKRMSAEEALDHPWFRQNKLTIHGDGDGDGLPQI